MASDGNKQSGGDNEEEHRPAEGKYTDFAEKRVLQKLMLGVQQSATALDALEGIVRRVALLVKTKVVLICLFILELLDISPDDDADI